MALLQINPAQHHIPTEVYVDFLGTTIPVHRNYHAYLMVFRKTGAP